MIRAAIYCRLSEEDRNKRTGTEESESIQNQKSLLLEYCKERAWKVIGVFSDEDMSGADRGRPAFNRMLDECAAGRVDVVLCKTQSRFSRDVEVIEHYIHNKFTEWGIRFIGVLDHADTEDMANKKSRQINGLVNEWYLEDLSENIKKTLWHKKEKGIYTGAFAPYGYRLFPEKKGKLFVDVTAACVVKKIFALYLSGMGYVKIAKRLNEDGVPCPSEYKRLCGSRFQTHGGLPTSNMWTDATVRQILLNPVYNGTLVQRKTEKISYKSKKRRIIEDTQRIVTPHAHDPIIDMEQWNRVQSKIGGVHRMQKNGNRHVFAGKIFCGVCGSSMWKMSYRLKDGRYAYFKCRATKCANGICKNTQSVRFDDIYTAVEEEIRKILELNYMSERIDRKIIFMSQQVNKDTKELRNLVLKQNCNMKQLYKDKLDGIIDNEIFYEIHKEIKKNISMLEKQIQAMEEVQDGDTVQEEYITYFAQKMRIDEIAVSYFIEKIEIGPVIENSRTVTIYWNL